MSLIQSTYQEEVQKLIRCFEKTETKVKHLEQDTFELAIPSINQLRYVAYHVLKASKLDNTSVDNVKEEIKKALNYCQRAKFDAVEIWITFLLEEIRLFERIYSPVKETQDVISNYSKSLIEAQNASNELRLISDEKKIEKNIIKR